MAITTTDISKTTKRIPVVLSGHALRSLRDSGYSLAAALGEVIDNSLEADANNILLRLEETQDKHGKKHIHRIVVVDDGSGMGTEILPYYLQVGFSTRYMQKDTIGKYGVGAKLAALNYGRRIDVWSRTREEEPWQHVYFDLDDAIEQEEKGEVVGIEMPNQEPVPDELVSLLPNDSGTVVVWSKVDRLEEGRRAPDAKTLRVEVEKELSRMFRYFLHGGIKISVNDTKLLPYDPLFLMEGTWTDKELTKYYSRISKANEQESQDNYQSSRKTHFPALIIANKERIEIGGSIAELTVTVYPKEVAREPGTGGDELAKKLRVVDNGGCISFVRLEREINYTNVPRIFPRGVQTEDRFLGIEVAFKPELDDYFGVRNVKRGVEPHDELRAKMFDLLKKYVAEARAKLDDIRGEAARDNQTHQGEHTPLVKASKKANRTLPKSRAKGPDDRVEQERVKLDLAKDVIGNDKKAQEEYLESIKDLPFVIESVDFPGHTFIDIQHLNGQVIIRLNTRHRFYREMWEPIRSIAQRTPGGVSGDEAVRAAKRTIEALTLLIIAYGKAESMDENPRERYGDLRMYWGQFSDSLIGKVKDVI
ncbi:ATP-binding protein [Coleofasciculus sp. FACHB-1120]|uniref:ATP-binding protein n=1 Tax=Coleofasciculus sp. FACHB-1120 TaxID=2692783 RepID=UPI00168A1B2C|nr:ATP-binding protein [Coleofasciculus sp. FACHB-1120]MBD2741506.1 ATP-binding protein [Coleofasciculus sp. FACHB-1120]